ncbi:DUF349 domain-containing protein [Microbacterium flavescens]|uniref:DUF349 domain-containing protein n=1 Tax=Microbacterium flavescens TaxID=69366 RepID=UPI0027DD3506|nr:DUF349 domain-containing protein [Microbacterium flavescens]BFF11370.1 DUF349 domain-containing protein [Microbacterium flavescens]
MTAAAESTPESTGPVTDDVQPETETVDADAVGSEAADAVQPEAEEAVEAEPEAGEAVPEAEVVEAAPESELGEPEGGETEPEVAEAEAGTADAAEPEADVVEPEVAEAAATEAEPVEPEPAKPAAPAGPVPTPRPRATIAPKIPSPTEPWGRVEDDGTVSVREGDEWRVVGQFPDGSPEEALAYFERKYADLASEVTLLEVRHRRGGASASDLRAAAKAVSAKLDGAAAVGDLASLEARVAALTETLAAASESEAAAAREAVDEAVRARTELVEKAEALAARDPRSVQWKQATAELNELFEQWQAQQQNGPRLPKSAAQQLWKRFRDARSTVDKHRREFYAELDEAHKGVRERKTKLVEKAEALAPKGEDGIPAYRELLDQWKTAGRAGKKVDDALWARFKAAGDALYAARIERESADAEASREKIEAKRALLVEAKAVGDERNLGKARTLLTGIQRRWDEIGRIFPRDAERSLDDDLRKIEQALRTREDADWKSNNPETKARANDMTRQLTDAIEKLENELEAAKKGGDKKAIADATDALEARKAWLKAVGG